jgi:hypothetical protein
MIETGATSTEEIVSASWCCARPTGDSHTRTTDAPAQRIKGAMRRPRGLVKGKRTTRPRGQYKGRSPKAPPEVLEELR